MVASTDIANTEIFAIIIIRAFKLMTHTVLFVNRKDKKIKVGYFLRK